MSDTMLLGVLRIPVHDYGDLALIQLIGRAQEAADRIESDAVKIGQLREALSELEEMASDCDDGQYMDYPDARGVFEKARAALKATE